MKTPLKLLILTILLAAISLSLRAQDRPHHRIVTRTNVQTSTVAGIFLTNIVQELAVERCATYHYFGLKRDGSIQPIGALADHDPGLEQFQQGLGALQNDYLCVLRAESDAKLESVWGFERRFDRLPERPIAPPLPPVPVSVQMTNKEAGGGSGSGSGGASVVPDTTPPTTGIDAVEQAGPYPIKVFFSYTIQSNRQLFALRFPVSSNFFYTVWRTDNLNQPWTEFLTPTNIHPARGNFYSDVNVPVSSGSRFYQVRSFSGGNRITWQ